MYTLKSEYREIAQYDNLVNAFDALALCVLHFPSVRFEITKGDLVLEAVRGKESYPITKEAFEYLFTEFKMAELLTGNNVQLTKNHLN